MRAQEGVKYQLTNQKEECTHAKKKGLMKLTANKLREKEEQVNVAAW